MTFLPPTGDRFVHRDAASSSARVSNDRHALHKAGAVSLTTDLTTENIASNGEAATWL